MQLLSCAGFSLAGELVARAVEHGDWVGTCPHLVGGWCECSVFLSQTLVLLALRSSLDVPEDILVRLLQHALQ